MSKAEKLKKICKKVWNLIIPIIIISAIIGAILIVPKYYNKSGGAIETAKLTVSPSHNWEILAASILGGFFLAILILVLVLNSKRKSSKSRTGAKSYGKIWNWVIPILIISAIIGGILIVPKYYGKAKVSQINAVFSWEKEPSQYGLNPEIRRSIPQETVITRNDDKVLNFNVYYYHKGGKEVSIFEGEKVSNGKIEGTWRQVRPKDGGEWYLKTNLDNERLFTGKYSDGSGEWIPMKLKIKLN